MITITGTAASAEAWVRGIQTRVAPTIDHTVVDALDTIIRELQAVTPVVSGKMFADYTISGGGDVWELLNTAESPGGYAYAGRVAFDPGFSQAYDALNQVLDRAELDLGTLLDVSITRMTTTAP